MQKLKNLLKSTGTAVAPLIVPLIVPLAVVSGVGLTASPALAQNGPQLAAPADERGGLFVRAHGLMLFKMPDWGQNAKIKNLAGLVLSNNNTGATYNLNRGLGYGGGVSLGYDFGSVFLNTGVDYIRQGFTTTSNQSGHINNYMVLAGVGTRFGDNFGFTIAADYGMNFVRISGLTGESNGVEKDPSHGVVPTKHHDDDNENVVGFLQHNIIGTLQLDYTFGNFVSLGAFGKY